MAAKLRLIGAEDFDCVCLSVPWNGPADGLTVYMGRDKFENEELIKHMWPEDVWFHVDDLSSAHVYLRLPLVSPGQS